MQKFTQQQWKRFDQLTDEFNILSVDDHIAQLEALTRQGEDPEILSYLRIHLKLEIVPCPPNIPGFEVLKNLGSGAMGEVYLALRQEDNLTVALKVLKQQSPTLERQMRFEREYKTLKTLNHDHIVKAHEFNWKSGSVPPYLVMEFIEGQTLESWICNKPQDMKISVEMLLQVALAVSAAHTAGVIHRDLKPMNVMLASSPDHSPGFPKVTDFGLARFIERGQTITEPGAEIGTPGYMAPEQYWGLGREEADVYALGAILYKMLTGETPRFDNPLNFRDLVPPQRLRPDVPEILDMFCRQCLQKNTWLRPSLEKLILELERYLNGERSTYILEPINNVFEASTSAEITATLQHLGSKELSLDGLIVLWASPSLSGIDASLVEISPQWKCSSEPDALIELPPLPDHFKNYSDPYWEETKERCGEPNNPKVWITRYRSPSTETPTLQLEVGKTNFWEARSLERAFDNGELKASYEKGNYQILSDLPGILFVAVLVVTSDNQIIISQRKGQQVGDNFAGGTWSPSYEEQLDPRHEVSPTDTVLRGLSEEFNADQEHGIHVGPSNIKLLALARQWGQYWHPALVYRVDLPATAEMVLDCWNSIPPPKDKAEHIAVAALDLKDPDVRSMLEDLVRNRDKQISWKDIGEQGVQFRGTPSDGDLHPTIGRARVIYALHS